MTTMQEIAGLIDPIYQRELRNGPASAASDCRVSLRALATRFRTLGTVPGETPANGVSLEALAARVKGAESTKLEFLHYNTYLMQGTIPITTLVRALGGWQIYLRLLGLELLKVLARCLERIDLAGFCERYFGTGIDFFDFVNPAYEACMALANAAGLASWLLELVGDEIDAALDLAQVSMDIIVAVVCELTGLPDAIPFKNTEEIDERAAEIGVRLRRYDLVALCEVWQQKHKDALLSAAGNSGPCFTGPADPSTTDWQLMGSGLLTFSPTGRPISADPDPGHGYHEYIKTGVSRGIAGLDVGKLLDADQWSRKGVQLTLVDVGCGTLEIYSTHTYSGGDMPGLFYSVCGGDLLPEEKEAVRQEQIAELAQFVSDTHDESRVAIIVGDLNVPPAERPGLHNQLRRIRDGLEFDDWYDLDPFWDVYPNVYAVEQVSTRKDFGHTNRGGGDPTFDEHCPWTAGHPLPDPFPPDYLCNERWAPANAHVSGDRIDYIFVQRPAAAHAFNLDVSRIRRRAFRRIGEGHVEPYLSDHVGLEVTLFVSPR